MFTANTSDGRDGDKNLSPLSVPLSSEGEEEAEDLWEEEEDEEEDLEEEEDEFDELDEDSTSSELSSST